jgi:hypothetical protein
MDVPGGVTWMDNMDGLAKLDSEGSYRESIMTNEIRVEDLRGEIRKIFFSDLINLPDKSYMTAFEVARAFELMNRRSGPATGRAMRELLKEMVERDFSIMLREDAFPPVPAVLQGGADIDIEYQGPIAKSQHLAEIEALERTLSITVPLAELAPQIIDNFDLDAITRWLSDSSGVPVKLLRDGRLVNQIREERARERQEAQQLEVQTQEAEAMGKLVPALQAMTGGGSRAAA